ncbi:MAG: hypothetical protein HZA53_17710 [Planctomycetes bacterium]|nr:hypothetical protein [Planctomycetota bacterium]
MPTHDSSEAAPAPAGARELALAGARELAPIGARELALGGARELPLPGARELALAALVAAVLALAWLARPIARLGDAVFAPTDVVQSVGLARIDGAGETVNGTQGDVAVQFLPWLRFQRDELRAGRVPLWNPYDGNGAPHLANGQSAVFSPFSVPFYVLDPPLALIASAFLRLWLAGFAGYWLLRELRASRAASACGALVLAACGHQMILLQYPHSAVAACAVLALAFAARVANAVERGESARFACAGTTLALAAAALAGHPEVLFFAGSLYVLLAVALVVRLRRTTPSSARRVALRLLACALVAAGLSAFQWMPFLEYLAHSSTAGERAAAFAGPPRVLLARLFFPELLGGPPPNVLLPHAGSLLDVAPTRRARPVQPRTSTAPSSRLAETRATCAPSSASSPETLSPAAREAAFDCSRPSSTNAASSVVAPRTASLRPRGSSSSSASTPCAARTAIGTNHRS